MGGFFPKATELIYFNRSISFRVSGFALSYIKFQQSILSDANKKTGMKCCFALKAFTILVSHCFGIS